MNIVTPAHCAFRMLRRSGFPAGGMRIAFLLSALSARDKYEAPDETPRNEPSDSWRGVKPKDLNMAGLDCPHCPRSFADHESFGTHLTYAHLGKVMKEHTPLPVPKEITIKYNHPSTSETVTKRVLTDDYIPAKIKQLGEFGYPGLTDKNIRDQLYALRNGQAFGKGLDAIGMMLKDEVSFE